MATSPVRKTEVKHTQIAIAAKDPAEPRNLQGIDLGHNEGT
jgi:hypothetical protein